MKLMLAFFRACPAQTVAMLIALLMAGVAEGLGLSTLLPFLNVAIEPGVVEGPAEEQNELEQMVVETLNSIGISPSIGVLLTIMVLCVTIKSLLLLLAKRLVGYTAARVATDLRLSMLRAVMRCQWEYFLHQPIGKLSNSLATEAQRSAEAFIHGATVITVAIQAVIYGSVALFVSWEATVICLAASVVILGILQILVRMARKAGQRQTNLLIHLLARLTDMLQSVKPLKAMAKEDQSDSALANTTGKINRALQKQVFSAAALDAAQELMFAIVIAVGMYLALVEFQMEFATVIVLVIALSKMLGQIGKVQKQYQKLAIEESAFWSLENSIEQAENAEEHLGGGAQPSLSRGIDFERVNFSYDHRDLIKSADLEFPAGQLTTIIGPSGSGKTTLIDLVIGLLRAQSGTILIDGQPIDKLDLRAWRRMIGYVPQEALLLHDTILHNVTLGDPELSQADAETALRLSDAWEFVEHLPDGLSTMVGERGAKLSGGQRQRIMIARALVHNPKLLILDEATSALDPASELEIGRTMRALRGRLTILAISHQDTLVEAADRVYRLEHGTVVSPEYAC